MSKIFCAWYLINIWSVGSGYTLWGCYDTFDQCKIEQKQCNAQYLGEPCACTKALPEGASS